MYQSVHLLLQHADSSAHVCRYAIVQECASQRRQQRSFAASALPSSRRSSSHCSPSTARHGQGACSSGATGACTHRCRTCALWLSGAVPAGMPPMWRALCWRPPAAVWITLSRSRSCPPHSFLRRSGQSRLCSPVLHVPVLGAAARCVCRAMCM